MKIIITKRGRPAGDNRRFFNAVAWIMRSGAPWRDLPPDYGNWNSIFVRFRRLAKAGFWEKLNYATKQTYDARMWQTIEYKAAAIEQFRKGDLLQRIIDDVQSEAANAAEMKAAASGNPLILMQVQLAADLRKLEAL